jgi:hypothetical protein
MKKLIVPVLAALIAATVAAFAVNTTFVTSIGDLVFPFGPPPTNPPGPGSITNMSISFSGTGTPTVPSATCAAGNGSLGAGSTNQSGLLQIGASATASCVVAFSTTLSPAPVACNATPANAAAAAQGTTVARISAVSGTGFTITGTALANANYYYTCF